MSDNSAMDRIQPCLLMRLTNDTPEAKNESRDARVISLQRYRESVIRDIQDLLNTRAHPPQDDVYKYGEVASSVLNYGIRDLCGLTFSGADRQEVAEQIKHAIETFEPRILPGSLSVQMVEAEENHPFRGLMFKIEGKLWAQPIPDYLFIKTEIDVETGHCEVKG